MLLDYCIGKAASDVKEFYILPVMEKLIQYDNIAVNTIVKNKDGEVNSCDLLFSDDLDTFNHEYMTYTGETATNCMNSGFNNPFLIWGRYTRKLFRYYLVISFQFHHTQMDGAHGGRFLENLQKEINSLK